MRKIKNITCKECINITDINQMVTTGMIDLKVQEKDLDIKHTSIVMKSS